LINLETLSARVLKTAYYPDDDITTAELGSRPSQVWRSILEGRDILLRGLIRRIGNGQDTNIWSQNWIPTTEMLRPYVAKLAQPAIRVSDLINASMCS
jgi:hypothetical protein